MNDDSVKVKGSFRLAISENGEIVGDSGWHENTIVNQGFLKYLVQNIGGLAGSYAKVSHISLGSGTAPGATATTLPNECVEARAAVDAATTTGSKTVVFTATFASSDSYLSATKNISNVGLFGSSASGTIFCGNTYASSSVATNQDVYATYTIVFS